MALSNTQKNIAICLMEEAISNVKANAGISDFGEIDTEVASLRTAYDADPATATDANIDALHDKLVAISTPNLTSVTSIWSEADQG